TLCELLACTAGSLVPEPTLERCKVSIRMLAGTMLVVDLGHWTKLLGSVESLLTVIGQRRLAWDERLAQLIFELIEKEELLASCHERDGEAGGRNAVSPQEVDALIAEVDALREELEHAETVIPAAPAAAVETERMGRVATELGAACERVLAAIASEEWQTRSTDAVAVETVRKALGTIEFYAQAMDRIVASVEENVAAPKCDLVPIETALDDFASELVRETQRELEIRMHADALEMEPALMPDVYWILHAMVADIFERCDEPKIEIDIEMADRNGAIHGRVRDNGETFLSDSRLDHEDQLAFYPGLRHVVRTLKEHHGTLAVEPGGGKEARFVFTLPSTTVSEPLVVWERAGHTFAARASQVVDVVVATGNLRKAGSYGEHIMIHGRRVPLLKLDVLYPDAPPGNSHIVVLGALEKHVAFYAPSEGVSKLGVVLGDSIPVWRGIPHDVVRVDGRRVPLMDADDILRGYLSITGTLNADAISAAVSEERELTERDLVHDVEEAADPPAGNPEVLVIEQSESTRNALNDILARQRVRASFAGDVEEALGMIRSAEPRVIISEFRIPTMAAKKIVDLLREQGRSIPVLVTTSQSGKTADLLVEKLGASGYLSKPLSASQVASQLSAFLGVMH
ncbi:MAG TPA: response regulator, partial [Candidatus Krumholzibacteria bacterium]|nr:response regulator [Candidatus Krumholzibacteria bacterium]